MMNNTIIGCIAYSGKSAMSACIARGVDASWFDADNATVFEAAFGLFSQGKYIDMSVLVSAGCDVIHLQNCIDEAITPSGIDDYLDVFENERMLWVARELSEKIDSGMLKAKPENIREFVARAQTLWADVGRRSDPELPMDKVIAALIDEWETPKTSEIRLFWPLSNMVAQLQPITDELIYLAAKESVGKTSLATQMCVCYGHAGITTSLLSLESSRKRIGRRLLANVGGIDTVPLIRRDSLADYDKAREALPTIAKLPIRIKHAAMDIDQIRAWAMMEKAANSQFLVIDNMRHIRTKQATSSPVEHFRDLSVKLKWIRDDVELPMMVLHHLNDQDDVSWSKDIRRDADILLFLLPDEERSIPYDAATRSPGRNIIDILVDKNRDGRRNIRFPAEFDVARQYWSDYGRMDISEDGLA